MKQRTVTIPIEEFDHLRDFKKNILEKKSMLLAGPWDEREYIFMTEIEVIEDIQEINKRLDNKLTNLKYDHKQLKINKDFEIETLKNELKKIKEHWFFRWLIK